VELVTSNIIEPWFYGQRTGVSPLAVIVSAMFWTWAWGPMGLIMATPLTVCLVVIGHHVPSLRLFPILFGDKPVLAESARLYDRLLAGQSFEFTEAATASTSKRYLAEYYDKTALPALALAQADSAAGLLADHQTQRIAHAAWVLAEDLETVVEDELATAEDQPRPEGDDTSLVTNGRLDGLGRRIAVMGALTRLEDAAARMVAQALRAEGAEVRALPLRAALPRALGDFQPETMVIVTLDAGYPTASDLLIRLARRRLPGVRIGITAWHQGEAIPRPTRSPVTADFRVTGMESLFAETFGIAVAAEATA
jgi:AI-2E family transporter